MYCSLPVLCCKSGHCSLDFCVLLLPLKVECCLIWRISLLLLVCVSFTIISLKCHNCCDAAYKQNHSVADELSHVLCDVHIWLHVCVTQLQFATSFPLTCQSFQSPGHSLATFVCAFHQRNIQVMYWKCKTHSCSFYNFFYSYIIVIRVVCWTFMLKVWWICTPRIYFFNFCMF